MKLGPLSWFPARPWALIALPLLCACIEGGSTDNTHLSDPIRELALSVEVDAESPLATVLPHAFGMHTSVYDNALDYPGLPRQLNEAGITMLRYPGGGYSDNYHWSTHHMTPWRSNGRDGSQTGYLAPNTDFGHYVSLLDAFGGTAMITVNYGTNARGTGPGEPKEAAAWVAYANGNPSDETVIGLDSTGEDWRTVGFWATLRASAPGSPEDDGETPEFDFLRVSHPEPLGITYWEIGNEVFGNGYYDGDNGYEQDLHLPYDGTNRVGHEALSPTTYGRGVLEFIDAMKAVDPTIKVGAVLNTPPDDYNWGPNWNEDVLVECGDQIDFAAVHWYTGTSIPTLLRAPQQTIHEMAAELRASFDVYAGDNAANNAANIEITLTELGPRVSVDTRSQVRGLFAADSYATFMEHGFANIAWLELHAGGFLSERPPDVPGPAYKGIQLVHRMAAPGDTFVQANSSDPGVIVPHASRRADGSIGVMLINIDQRIDASVEVAIQGAALTGSGTLYLYEPAEFGGEDDGAVTGPTELDGLGNDFTFELPPFSIATLLLDAE